MFLIIFNQHKIEKDLELYFLQLSFDSANLWRRAIIKFYFKSLNYLKKIRISCMKRKAAKKQ